MNSYEGNLLTQLTTTLQQAIRESWLSAVALHADEQIYAYILYTTPLLESVLHSFNSEEALLRIARDESEHEELRWSIEDWGYYDYSESAKLFSKVNDLLEQLNTNRDYGDDEVTERLWQIFVDSLSVLDSQGLFGDGEARNTLTINIGYGDWDAVAHVCSARELNPVPSYLRFAQSQLKSMRYGLVEIERNRSPYTEEAIAIIQNTINMVTSDLESSG